MNKKLSKVKHNDKAVNLCKRNSGYNTRALGYLVFFRNFAK